MRLLLAQFYHNVLYGSLSILLLLAVKKPLLNKGGHFCYFYLWLIPIFGFFNPYAYEITAPLPAVNGSIFIGVTKESATYIYALLLIWFSVSICILIYFHKAERQIYKLAKNSMHPVSDNVLHILMASKAKLHVKQDVEIGIIDNAPTPLLLGGKRPLIILPNVDLCEKMLKFVLSHELLHLKYKDIWVKKLACFIQALFWWNPLVYILGRQMHEACELTCDYRVLKGKPATECYDYSQTVLDFARASAVPFSSKRGYNMVAFGFESFEQRFKLMIRPQQQIHRGILIGLASVMLIFSFFSFRSSFLPNTPNEVILSDGFEIVERADGFYDLYRGGELIVYGADKVMLESLKELIND